MKFSNRALTVAVSALAISPSVYGELKSAVSTNLEMVVSAHYLATEAGEKVLAAGGSAVDAMVRH
jgi:gamma-glutamyltranspeptidase